MVRTCVLHEQENSVFIKSHFELWDGWQIKFTNKLIADIQVYCWKIQVIISLCSPFDLNIQTTDYQLHKNMHYNYFFRYILEYVGSFSVGILLDLLTWRNYFPIFKLLNNHADLASCFWYCKRKRHKRHVFFRLNPKGYLLTSACNVIMKWLELSRSFRWTFN